jgi:hypothetical protein
VGYQNRRCTVRLVRNEGSKFSSRELNDQEQALRQAATSLVYACSRLIEVRVCHLTWYNFICTYILLCGLSTRTDQTDQK